MIYPIYIPSLNSQYNLKNDILFGYKVSSDLGITLRRAWIHYGLADREDRVPPLTYTTDSHSFNSFLKEKKYRRMIIRFRKSC